MTFYDSVYPFYPHKMTSYIFNINQLIVILVFLVFICTFLIILPGIRGKARMFWMFRIILSLFIGVVIVVVNFTSDWAIGYIRSNTTYKYFSDATVDAEIGLHVGLTGINVTLTGNPVHQLNETIDYNERFLWTGNYDEEYTEGLRKGLPNPILYLAEKFSHDSPCGLYFQYKYSGRYASATMWTAFCCWLISNVLLSMPVIVYGGYMLVTTGTFMIFSLISFSTIRNVPSCVISLGSMALNTNFGGSFWLSLATGLLCILLGTVIIILDICIPEKLKIFFNAIDVDDEDSDGSLTMCYVNISFIEKHNAMSLENVKCVDGNKTFINYGV
ncbi:dual oxidase maturation factor 2 [Polypterus senegalus]|uniref:dual oxidase maturation factor 2 n=1 Tax=Polypterus senegalus TaxID=55291 RepID=UPI001964A900|nr:dual oxidase maturation factor 2 [Polypterus senegalus]